MIAAVVVLVLQASPIFADVEDGFTVSEITPEIFARIKGKSYKDNCPIPLGDLRYLRVLHKDKDGVTHEGEMICSVNIASDVLEIFRAMYEAGYPIERVRLVDDYDADDETSMRDNNSSCFNFRFITHSTRISKHGLGLAVDINTLYNPYIRVTDKGTIFEPATAGTHTTSKRQSREGITFSFYGQVYDSLSISDYCRSIKSRRILSGKAAGSLPGHLNRTRQGLPVYRDQPD